VGEGAVVVLGAVVPAAGAFAFPVEEAGTVVGVVAVVGGAVPELGLPELGLPELGLVVPSATFWKLTDPVDLYPSRAARPTTVPADASRARRMLSVRTPVARWL